MRSRILTLLLASVLVACGGASKPVSPNKMRIIDVSAVNGNARLQSYEAANGQNSWTNDIRAYLEKCILPQMPEGTRVSWARSAPGPKLALAFYFIKPGIAPDATITLGRDTYYHLEIEAGRISVVVGDRGDTTVQGVAAAKAFGESMPGQFQRPLATRTDC